MHLRRFFVFAKIQKRWKDWEPPRGGLIFPISFSIPASVPIGCIWYGETVLMQHTLQYGWRGTTGLFAERVLSPMCGCTAPAVC